MFLAYLPKTFSWILENWSQGQKIFLFHCFQVFEKVNLMHGKSVMACLNNRCTRWLTNHNKFKNYVVGGSRASTLCNVVPNKLSTTPHYKQPSFTLYGSITFTIWKITLHCKKRSPRDVTYKTLGKGKLITFFYSESYLPDGEGNATIQSKGGLLYCSMVKRPLPILKSKGEILIWLGNHHI
jgi:hypothetical protein